LGHRVAENLFLDEPKENNIWVVDALRLKLRERTYDRAQSLWRIITTPRIQHLQIIDLPDKLHWLYYPIKLAYDYVVLPCWKLLKRIRKLPPGPRLDPDLVKSRSQAFWRGKAGAWGKWSGRDTEFGTELNRKLVSMVGISPGDMVLDVAGGAGNPGIYIADVVGSTGSVISTDVVLEMLQHSRQRASDAGIGNIKYCVADMDALPFSNESFDAVVSRFGLMFCKDFGSTLRSIRRLLKPNACAGFIVWGTRDKNPVFDISGQVYTAFFKVEHTETNLGPFRLSEAGVLEQLLLDAGFSGVEECEVVFDNTIKKGPRFWQSVLEQSFDVEFDELPEKIRIAFDQAIEEAFIPFLQGEQYHFTNSVRIAVGTA
jgi:ubiquinone/menaquinone biosynthesis C-methylase UbiE